MPEQAQATRQRAPIQDLTQGFYRTEKFHFGGIKHFFLFRQLHHLQELGRTEVETLLNYRVTHRNVATSMQNPPQHTILFFTKDVLDQQLLRFDGM